MKMHFRIFQLLKFLFENNHTIFRFPSSMKIEIRWPVMNFIYQIKSNQIYWSNTTALLGASYHVKYELKEHGSQGREGNRENHA